MVRIVLALASLLICADTLAWDKSATITTSLPADFLSPRAISVPDVGGYWVVGGPTEQPVLTRYDTSGTPQFSRYPQVNADTEQLWAISLLALPDRGVVVVDSSNACTLRKYDGTGNLRWTNSSLPPPYYGGPTCPQMRVDGSGGLWLSGCFSSGCALFYVSQDGALQPPIPRDPDALQGFVGDPQGSNVYISGSTPTSTTPSVARIEKISAKGISLWIWQADAADAGSSLKAINIGTDGNLQAFGGISTSGSTSAGWGAGLTHSGAKLWTRTLTELGTNLFVYGAVPTIAGASHIVANQTGQIGNVTKTLAKIDANGAVLWSVNPLDAPYGTSACCDTEIDGASNGDLVLAERVNSANPGYTLLLKRYDASGKTVFSRTFPTAGLAAMRVLHDGSTLLASNPPNASGTFSPPVFQHLATDGTVLAPPLTQGIVGGLNWGWESEPDPDGAFYVLSFEDSTQAFALNRVAADGTTAWQLSGSPQWQWQNTPAVVPLGGSVCLAGVLGNDAAVQCYASSTGQPGASVTLEHGVTSTGGSAYAAGSGQLVLLYPGSDKQIHHVLVTVQGQVLHNVTPLQTGETLQRARADTAGNLLVITSATGYLKLAPDGTRLFAKAIDPALGTLRQVYFAIDGSGLLLASAPPALNLIRIDSSGNVLWTRPLPAQGSQYSRTFISSLKSTADAIYLALGFLATPPQVMKLSLADGTLVWKNPIHLTTQSFPGLALDANGANVAVLSEGSNRIHEQVFDAATGVIRNDRYDACDADFCSLFGWKVGTDGRLRVITETSSDKYGYTRRFHLLDNPFAVPPTIRLDQHGINGAWYAPYQSGQGFVVDSITEANTLFMPWFTFTQNGTNDPAGLAWYTLQGSIATSATSADLGIYATDPGSFATGKVAAHAVGSAHVSFEDCNTGKVSFQFNADTNQGASGVISLTRLSPSDSICTLADGSTAPPVSNNPPAQGFDAQQSGSWYDSATSGQGIEIAVQPPGNGSSGLIFGAWFTFDPAGNSDDPLHQHWFTLQGDLSTAKSGKVTLPIYRTIGAFLNGFPTTNINRVGQAVLTMQGCSAASLDYQFDNSDVAHAFVGMSGHISLTKPFGCNSP